MCRRGGMTTTSVALAWLWVQTRKSCKRPSALVWLAPACFDSAGEQGSGFSPEWQGFAAQLGAQGGVGGQLGLHVRPKARAVVHLVQVGQFVNDDVVHNRRAKVHEPPVQADAAVCAGAAPAGAGRGQGHLLPAHAHEGREVVQPRGEVAAGLLLDPGLRGVAPLRGRGGGGQREIERGASCAAAIRVSHAICSGLPAWTGGAVQGGSRFTPQGERLAQPGQRSAFAPRDAGGMLALLPLLRLGELAEDPARF